MGTIYVKRKTCDTLGQMYIQEHKATKNQIVRFQLNEKVKGKQKINQFMLTTKADLREALDKI